MDATPAANPNSSTPPSPGPTPVIYEDDAKKNIMIALDKLALLDKHLANEAADML